MALGVLGKILAIIICLVLFLLSAIIRKHTKSTFHPAFIYSLYSGLLYLLSMLIIFPAPINPLGLLYILLCIISFCVPTLLTSYNNVRTVRLLNKLDADIALSRFESTFLRKLLSCMAILGVFSSIYIVVINGASFVGIMLDPIGISGGYSALRSNSGSGGAPVEYGLYGQLNILMAYTSASLGGYLYEHQPRKASHFYILLIALSTGLSAMIIQSSKIVFIISLIFFISTMCIVKILTYKSFNINFKGIVRTAGLAIIALVCMLLSFFSRRYSGDLADNLASLEFLRLDLASYFIAHIYAFSDFFAHYVGQKSQLIYPIESLGWGRYTFSSIAEIFGADINFPPGLYLQPVEYSNSFSTVIFSVYRGLILDFGLFGSFVIMAILGSVGNLSYLAIVKKPKLWFFYPLYSSIIVFIGMSPFLSVFMARYMYSTAALLILILASNTLISSNRIKVKFRPK